MKKIILLIGAFVAVSAAVTGIAEGKPVSDRPLIVTAEPDPMPPTRHVGYGDLNLTTQFGERGLRGRGRAFVIGLL